MLNIPITPALNLASPLLYIVSRNGRRRAGAADAGGRQELGFRRLGSILRN